MAINNALNINLVGTTGTGNFTGSTGATYVTPTLGAATATSLDFTSTAGIIATTTNNNAAAGSVGEVISSVVDQSSAVSITTGTAKDITSISLTAGDWDVFGSIGITGNSTTIPSSYIGLINSAVNLTPPAFGALTSQWLNVSIATLGTYIGCDVQGIYFRLSGTTTIYLVGFGNFTVSTAAMFGSIHARRRR